MFELTIDGVVYQFNFGIGFLRDINKTYRATSSGLSKEVGFQIKVAGLIDGDILDLIDVLDAANKGQSPRLTKKALEAYMENPETDIDTLFEDVLDFLKKNNVTRKETLKAYEAAESQKNK